jgi:hypothetical protein
MNFTNKSGLLARYEDKELILDYSKKAPTLREAIIFLHDAGILEEMIKDSREFSRTSPYEFTDHVGMSGSIDYYIRWYTSKGEFKGIRKTKLLVHISMSDKLNEGIHCFGPDLIAWLWYEPSINTYEILSMPKQVVYPLEVPDDTYPIGEILFFPTSDEIKRMEELKDLINTFREESDACLDGTLEFIDSKCNKVPEYWLERLSSETRNKIQNLTEKDWRLIREVARSLSKRELQVSERRSSRKARIETSEEVAPIEE